jgi:hypothetical protein
LEIEQQFVSKRQAASHMRHLCSRMQLESILDLEIERERAPQRYCDRRRLLSCTNFGHGGALLGGTSGWLQGVWLGSDHFHKMWSISDAKSCQSIPQKVPIESPGDLEASHLSHHLIAIGSD